MGGVVSGTGAIIGGIAAKRDAKLAAAFKRRLATVEARDSRRNVRRLLASQEVAFATTGADPGTGTPLAVLGDTVAEAELAILRAKFAREAEAMSMERRGEEAQTQGIISGISSIVSSVTSFGLQGGGTPQPSGAQFSGLGSTSSGSSGRRTAPGMGVLL